MGIVLVLIGEINNVILLKIDFVHVKTHLFFDQIPRIWEKMSLVGSFLFLVDNGKLFRHITLQNIIKEEGTNIY